MNLKPLFDRVVILPENETTKTESGIIFTTSSEEKSQVAKVVAVGEGLQFDGKETKMQVCVGDRVLFSKFSGTELKMENKNYVIIRQTDILAVIKEN